jgi:hypothetical protein
VDAFLDRISRDQRLFWTLVIAWVVVVIVALSCVFVIFFQGDDSGTDGDTTASTTPLPSQPPPILGGVTIVAASPAAGDSVPPAPTDAGAQAADTASLEPFPADVFGYGIQVQGSVGDPRQAVESVKKLGMNWIKQQVRWEHIEPKQGELHWEVVDGIINDAHTAGIRMMLSVVTTPAWARTNSGGGTHGPPDNYEEFGRFLGQLVDRYKGKVHAIEVWNEQNLDREWQSPNGLVAADYVRLLQIARREIKARDPNIIVISGALSPTGGWVEPDGRVTAIDDFAYFQELLNAGLLDYADCVGAHHNGINMPPDKEWNEGYNDPTATFRGPFENPHHSWAFKSTLWGYYNMMNGQRKLCVTEFGWPTSEGLDKTPQGFGFSDDNTLQEQAQWIVQAFQLQRDWGITWIAYLWNLDYSNKSGNPEDSNSHYSLVDLNGVPRPSYDAVQQMPKP